MSQANDPASHCPSTSSSSSSSSPLPTPLGSPPPHADTRLPATPPSQDTPTSFAEHYSTVCDAVDLSTRIYDEPPDTSANPSPANAATSNCRHPPPKFTPTRPSSSSSSSSSSSTSASGHRSSQHARYSCNSCVDLHYQPVDTSRGVPLSHPPPLPSSTDTPATPTSRPSSRRHQYDCVYIPAACEHAMRRRVDAGGYVRCRRGPPTILSPAPDHAPHYEPADEEAEEGACLLQNAYEHLEYGDDSRPVLPRRRESLPVATTTSSLGHTPPLSPTPSLDEPPPQLPPRHRPPEPSESNLYEKVELTHGCPMLRPLSLSSSNATRPPPPILDSTSPAQPCSLDNPIPVVPSPSPSPPPLSSAPSPSPPSPSSPPAPSRPSPPPSPPPSPSIRDISPSSTPASPPPSPPQAAPTLQSTSPSLAHNETHAYAPVAGIAK